MKRLLLVAIAPIAALCMGACGGGSSSNTNTPPPALGFANSSLNGTYAFEMSGSDLNGNLIARIGSFTANGSGTITVAVEDVNDVGSTTPPGIVQFTGGSYTVGSDGRGTLTFTSALGTGLVLNMALSSTKSGVLVQTDGNATSSGSFDLQTPAAFATTGIVGQYAFDLAGIDSSGAPVSIAGEFAASGGSVTGGEMDVNDGNSPPPSGPPTAATPIPAATFTPDSTFFASAGRGTVLLNGLTVVFYMVDATRLRFLEEDASGATAGDAFVQTGTIPTSAAGLNGNFAFISAGAAVLGNHGSIARAGSIAFNGSGGTSNAFLDDNNSGSHSALGPDAGSYAIESTGSGRGIFSFTDSGKGTFSYIFYLFSPSQALLLETSNGLIASGSMSAQPSSVSAPGLAGNYVFNWSGVTGTSSGNVGFEEDFIGQYVASASGSLSGAADFAELGSTSSRGPIFLGAGLTGTFNASGTGRNTYTVTLSPGNGAPATTIDFAAYVGANNTVYVVTTDSNRVTAGSVVTQTTP